MPTRKISDLLKLLSSNYKKNIKTFTIEELIKVLKKLSDAYYNTGEPLVSDEIYDELRDMLETLDPEHPFLDEVGAPVKGTKKKVKLPYEMGSLSKIKPETGYLEKWCVKYKGPYIVSDKLDGASVQLYKNKDGELALYSRGKSITGQDISHLIPYVVSKESTTNMPNNTSVRGELIISKENFSKISYMKNARNAVAGLVNSKTIDVKIAKISEFVSYAVLFPRYIQSEQMKLLTKWKFTVVPYKKVKHIDDDSMKKYLIERKDKTEYEIDGLVCVDDSDIYTETGGHPDYAFAFKMLLDDQSIIANVVDIKWDPSMDGYLKPRVEIEPINISGVTITYATAHNAKFIVDNNLGPGAKIKITRSGDVIPYILEVIQESTSKKPLMPNFEYKWNESKVDLVLKDSDKIGKEIVKIKLLIHFFNQMGIKFLSEGIITKLVNEGYDTVAKILKAKKSDLNDIDGLGTKMVTKIYEEIDKSFDEVDLPTFMAASHKFGRGLAKKKLEEVVNVYPNILTEKWSVDEIEEKLLNVPGFGDKLAQLFAENFNDFMKFYNEISKIKDLSRFESLDETDSDSDDSTDNFMENEKIVFTGFRDAELEKLIKKYGGKVTGTVTSNTTILVHKDGESTSSKISNAKAKGTTIMSKTEFIKKYFKDQMK